MFRLLVFLTIGLCLGCQNKMNGHPSDSRAPASLYESNSSEAAHKLNYKFGVILDGVNQHHPPAIKRAADAHLGWIRLHGYWRMMEPVEGQINFEILDRYVNEALSKKQKVYIGLGFFPPQWANGTVGQKCDIFADPCASLPPTDPTKFRRFVRAVVKHYKGRVQYFAIWNEPDFKGFWNGPFEQYIKEILIPGAQAVKAANRDAKVIGPEIFDSEIKLSKSLQAACSLLDVVAVHLFRETTERNIRHLTSHQIPIIANDCPGKPIWVTAFGAPYSITDTTPLDEIRKLEQDQADQFTEMLDQLNAIPEIKKIIFYTMVDLQKGLKQGVLRTAEEDYAPKPAYRAIRNYIGQLDSTRQPN